MTDSGPWEESLEEFRGLRERIRTELGGQNRVKAVHSRGTLTVRERIDRLLDPGSFSEIGTFSWSEGRADEWLPGDGKVGGHGRIDGRPVTVVGDDVTVLRASSAYIGNRKIHKLYEQALRAGTPFLFLGECGGGRIPDILGAAGFSRVGGYYDIAQRARRIPIALAIVGDSFGASTLMAGLADFTVQVRGTCLAVTSPRVIEVATGEQITTETLGGADVHARNTGLIDLAVETEDDAFTAVREFLSYLPSNADVAAPTVPSPSVEADPGIVDVVPRERRRVYDVHRLIERIVDDRSFFELQPQFGGSVVGGLARIGGRPIGLIASQPSHVVGALTPDSCDKAARLICLCDAFGLPIVMLQDTPGFLVGSKPEHQRLVAKAMLLSQAYALARVPKITVLLRKGFGLGYFTLGGNDQGVDLLYAWAGAEIGFMDPQVGANIIYADELAQLPPQDRARRRQERADELARSTDVLGPAGILNIDEVIDPADTRPMLTSALQRLAARPLVAPQDRPLAWWPNSW